MGQSAVLHVDGRHVDEDLHGAGEFALVHASVVVAEVVEHAHAVLDANGWPSVEQRLADDVLGRQLQDAELLRK